MNRLNRQTSSGHNIYLGENIHLITVPD